MSFIRTKKIHGRDYRYEVENYRENGKVKQRVLQYLGAVLPVESDTPQIVVKATRLKVSKKGNVSISIAGVPAGQYIQIKYSYPALPKKKNSK